MDNPLALYALSTGVGIILVLVGAVYALHRREADNTREALEKKASEQAVRDLRAESVQQVRDLQERFLGEIRNIRADNDSRIQALQDKQTREIDWLKDELNTFNSNLNALREQQMQSTNSILQRLQDLSVSLQRG